MANNNNDRPIKAEEFEREKALRAGNAFTRQYVAHKKAIRAFLETFESDLVKDAKWGKRKYMFALQKVADKEERTIVVDLADMERFCENYQPPEDCETLLLGCRNNMPRYRSFFYDKCLELLDPEKGVVTPGEGVANADVDNWHKKLDAHNKDKTVPSHMKCKFLLRFKRGSLPTKKLREIASMDVGSLVAVNCTVTRATPVRPKIDVLTYCCSECLTEAYLPITTESFTPLTTCESETCKKKKAGKMQMHIRSSKLTQYQELRVQELADEVPTGSTPRSFRVVALGDLTRKCVPGDKIELSAIYIPTVRGGFQDAKRGNLQEMHLEAQNIAVNKVEDTTSMDKKTEEEITRLARDNDMYELLSEALAPEIFGHTDIKKALVLMLCGGVHKKKKDGMKLRGDIHMLMMGDPGVAKSQLLKQVCRVAPRAVYTSGKGSSNVGLTAAVVRDQTTGEVTLEGGALVLADRGICAIDEFDKMEEADRASIHEVMEQQTVSIAKGGITTSLNARACVVAAANPQWSRWNLNKSITENINLPDSLLSRFDLQFVLIDKVQDESDLKLAKHVGYVHRYLKPPPNEDNVVYPKAKIMRAFIANAQKYEPEIKKDVAQTIVNMYAELRSKERETSKDDRKTITTPRTLLGMLRMSQARARLRLSNTVEAADFDEAVRLMQVSKSSCEPEDEEQQTRYKKQRNGSQIYHLITEMLRKEQENKANPERWVSMQQIERKILDKGFTKNDLDETIVQYISVDVLEQTDDHDKIRFIFAGTQ
jgi:DNA replication licensing factor MCM7